ncbi:MFS transporter [Pacificimonas sp. ICDLI1SI03]
MTERSETWQELARGWPILLACAIGVGCSAIALPFYSIGPLTKPIAAEMGWARSGIQFAIVFSSGIGALTAPLTGWMIARFGARNVAIPSLVGVAVGLLVASFATSLQGFWLGYALAAILGAGTNPVLWSQVVASTFDKARGAALGLALIGTAAVAFILPNLVAAVEPAQGWRFTLRVIALTPVLIGLPVVYFLLRPQENAGAVMSKMVKTGRTVKEAITSYRFWVLTFSILLGYLAISGAGPNLMPAFTDRGIGVTEAAAIASVYAVAMVPGRILSGFLMDRFWAPAVACTILILPAFACVILANSTVPSALIAACALLGLAAGAELDVLAFLTARYFGLAHYSQIYSLSYVALAAGSATAPTLFSLINEMTNTYEASFYIAGGLFVCAALPILLLGRYPQFDERQS